MQIFITEINNGLATLNAEESRHCFKVLRYRVNDEVNLIDGKGNFYKGVLNFVSEKKCTAEIVGAPIIQEKRNYYLHLAIAPTKQMDRIEWLIEKAVEIGIDEISFIKCKNSERTVVKTGRVRSIVESAVKQSKQAYIPKINELTDFKNIVKCTADLKFIAHCFNGEKKSLNNYDFSGKKILVLIGPEGDFTEEEVALANKSLFVSLDLGKNRLRTETAGLYVVQAVSILT